MLMYRLQGYFELEKSEVTTRLQDYVQRQRITRITSLISVNVTRNVYESYLMFARLLNSYL